MREALLAAAALATLAAGLRAARHGRALATAGVLATLAAFAAGAFLAAPPPPRTGLLVFAGTLLAKLAALGRGPHGLGFARGLAYLLAFPGLTPGLAFVRDARARRGAGLASLATGLAEAGAGIAAAALADRVGVLAAGPFPAAAARMLALLLVLDGTFRLTRGALVACGLASEVLSRAPWAAADLADFWGRRWNLLVARTLAADVYGPVRAVGGRAAGVLGAFLVSGVYHEALFALPTGGPVGAPTAFFLLHGLAVLGTRGPALRRRPALARAIAWAVFLATAPLFFGGAYPAAAPLEHVGR